LTSGGALAAGADAADVLIQAGHQGRPDCSVEPPSLCRNTGASRAPGEIVWTPIVADEATRVLKAHGVSVLRMPASLPDRYNVRVAVFIHFDASPDPQRPCNAHSSEGYPADDPSKVLAQAWKRLYGRYWPYGFARDNYTANLTGYYGYHRVAASKGQLLIEAGEMTCPADYAWLSSHLRFLGELVAYFVSLQIGKGNVPLPRE
jgi:hypothetical protein